jgi:DNA-binding response OmpR family regulator
MSEKILIVDDDPEICALCAEALSEDGYQVITSTNGDEALELAQHEEFDVVLSDLRMPGMTGLELLKNLKGADSDQAVIMFSGFGDMEIAVEAMKLGAYDSLPKPLILDELRLTVGKAMRQNRLRRENEKLRRELQDSTIAMTYLPKFIPLLQNLPKDATHEFIELGHVETINSNDLILQENSSDHRLYIVIEGEISVWQDKAELYRLGRGESYGEMNILRRSQRSQGLLAELPGQLLILERDAILAFFNKKEERIFKLFIFNILNSVYTKNLKLCSRLIQLERMLKG